ncbi:hypothetical protein BofuT4_uP089750.1 [Botrytis cinerea T4]|uniref:Uncharacterized protein n=1 Tax=Botryotinia fuckeliana (strain T4) TaxID=999810 RepID=G2YF81_BOTF4|nr:hypothetical protein BofuT4_uP089750.1 [Botrytis cinerea T4]
MSKWHHSAGNTPILSKTKTSCGYIIPRMLHKVQLCITTSNNNMVILVILFHQFVQHGISFGLR